MAVLYGGRIFACRHGHRLGWASGIGLRPKGMHWATYLHLCDELDRLDERALLDVVTRATALPGLRS